MKKISNKIFYFVLGLILIFPTIKPFFDSRIMTFHDETQFANIHQYIKAINLGQFPPRWAPDMQYTYGSPFPEFNYQLPYYLAFIISKFGVSLIITFKILMVLSLLLAFCGFYIFILDLSSPAIALISALVYTYTPYRAVNVYVRGSLGESLAFAIFPFILLYLFRLKNNPNFKNLLITAVFIALLFINHQPATILTLPFIYLVSIFTTTKKDRLKSLSFQVLSGVIALLLSAYYWIPVLSEQKYLKSVSPFNFYDHFPFIKQLIYSAWGHGSSNWGQYDDMSFQLGIVNQLFIVSAILMLVYGLYRKVKIKYQNLIFSSLIAIFASLFLMNVRSSFFWQIFPFTQQIQFPWRLLMVPVLFTSIITALILTNLKLPQVISRIGGVIIIILLIALNFSYFAPGGLFQRDDNYFLRRFLPNQVLLAGEKISPQYLLHSEDYVVLPRMAIRPTDLPEGKISSPLKIQVKYLNANPFNTIADIISFEGGYIDINNFYFPGWEVILDGNKVPTLLNEYGAMRFFVEKGEHQIKVTYSNTPVRRISNIISIGTISIFVSYLFFNSIKKWKIKF